MKNIWLFLIFLPKLLFAQQEIDYDFQREMYSKSLDELRLIRNEFFARRGYKFTNKDLEDHFNQFSWYKGTESIDEINLSIEEQAKVNFIKKVESQKSLNSVRIKVLDILVNVPNESMQSWNWSIIDRHNYVANCKRVGYLINDNSGMMQKIFFDDWHFKVQVVDGSWEMLVIHLSENSFFVITVDIVGDGHYFKTYKLESQDLTELKVENVFPETWFTHFVPDNSKCVEFIDPYTLQFILQKDKINIESWYSDECLLKKQMTFQFNKEEIKYELLK